MKDELHDSKTTTGVILKFAIAIVVQIPRFYCIVSLITQINFSYNNSVGKNVYCHTNAQAHILIPKKKSTNKNMLAF